MLRRCLVSINPLHTLEALCSALQQRRGSGSLFVLCNCLEVHGFFSGRGLLELMTWAVTSPPARLLLWLLAVAVDLVFLLFSLAVIIDLSYPDHILTETIRAVTADTGVLRSKGVVFTAMFLVVRQILILVLTSSRAVVAEDSTDEVDRLGFELLQSSGPPTPTEAKVFGLHKRVRGEDAPVGVLRSPVPLPPVQEGLPTTRLRGPGTKAPAKAVVSRTRGGSGSGGKVERYSTGLGLSGTNCGDL